MAQGFSLEEALGKSTQATGGFSLEEALGKKPEESGFLRQATDIPLSIGRGALTGVRMVADAFGAGSRASEAIKNAEGYVASLMSAQARNDEQEIARIMKDAEDKGVLDQVQAAFKAFSVAPVDLLTQGLGTAGVGLLGMVGGKVLGAGTLGLRAIGAATGAGMGAGAAKGGIYEEVKSALIEAGESPQKAEQVAQQAQAYGGKNLDQILLGTALGAAAGTLGLEGVANRILTRAATKEAAGQAAKGALREAGEGALRSAATEAIPEVAQASQEQLAKNIALQREGFDVPTMRGVTGAGVLEGLAGAGLGAIAGGTEAGLRRQARTEAERILAEEERLRIAQEQQAERQRIEAERVAEEERMRPIREAEARVPAEEPVGPSITGTERTALLGGEPMEPTDPLAAAISARRQEREDAEVERERRARVEIPGAEEPAFNLLRGTEARNLGLMSTLEARRTAAEQQAETERQERERKTEAERADADRRMSQVENFLLSPARKTQQETADYIAGVVPEMQKDFLALLDEDLNQPLTPEQTEALKAQIRQRLSPEAAPEPEVKRTPFKSFLARVGINRQDARDIFGDNSFRANQRLPGAIRADAPRLDMLAEAAVEAGFLKEEDPDALLRMIQDEFFGSEQVPLDMMEDRAAAEIEARRLSELESRAAAIGLDTRDMTPEQIIGRLNRIERTRQQQRQRKERETEARTEADIAELTATEREARAEAMAGEAVSEVDALRQQARDQGIDVSDIEYAAFEEARENPDINPDTILAERLSDALGLPRYQRSTKSGKSIGKEQTQSVVDAVTARWANAPEVVVAENMDDPAIPAEVREHNKAAMRKGAKGSPRGFFYKGKAYILADAATSARDVMETLFHESLGHYGLRGTFGPEMESVLRDVVKYRKDQVEAKAKQYGLDPKSESDMLEAAEEVLAEIAQTKPGLSFVKRAIAVIRNFLRKLGLPFDMSNDDIIQKYILPARAFVEKGGSKGVEGKPAAMREVDVPTFFEDIPNENWLKEKIDYAMRSPRNEFGVPKMSSVTGRFREPVMIPARWFKDVKGQRGEEKNVRQKDLAAIRKIIRDTGKLPLNEDGTEYVPYVEIGYDGKPWISEGNHRIMAAIAEGMEYIPVELRYFDGGQRRAGVWGPGNVASITERVEQENPAASREEVRYQREAEPEERVKEPKRNILGLPVIGSWTMPTDTKLAGTEFGKDDLIYSLQDKQVDIKRVVQNITETAGRIASKWNPYLQEELYHGRTARATKEFLQDELRPLIQEIQRNGMTIEEVEKYLHNRHAEDYNKHVAKVNPRNPKMQDGGSGIKTEDARAYLANIPADKRKVYEDIAKKVDAITKATRNLVVESGLEGPDTIAAWEKVFPKYVPLMREESDDFDYTTPAFGVGSGFDVRGKFSRAAMGSERKVANILANIAMQREKAIIKSNKNRVAQAVFGLAAQNPNPDFWMAINPDLAEVKKVDRIKQKIANYMAKKSEPGVTNQELADIKAGLESEYKKLELAKTEALDAIEKVKQELVDLGIPVETINLLMQEPEQRVLDPKKNEVVSRINPRLRENDNVLAMRVNGENRYVFFNQNDPRAKRAAQALKNIDADQLGPILGIVSKVTRWMAAVNTQYNPIFGAYNFLRDVQGAALQLSDTPLRGMQKQVLSGVLPSLKTIYSAMRAERDGKKLDTEMGRLWNEFQKEGGQTGFRDMFSRSQERAEALEKEFKQITEGKVKAAGRAVFDWLSDYNDSMENATRLSAYKVAKEKFLKEGMSESEAKQQAASIAKNLTVNFNRKGQIATQAGALYAFFNAAVQGTTRLIQTLRGPAGRKIIAGGLLLGTMQAALLAMAGFDEEEPPEFVRERNIIIPIGGDKYIAFPMPLGYHVIPGFSRIITEWALSGFKDTPDRIASLTGMFLEAFNPIGNAGWSVQTLAPTFADPMVALAENRDWTGKPIARKDFSNLDPTPGYTRAKDTASEFSTQIAKFLNYASGGTQFRPGVLSPTPDQIDYLIGQAFGGLGREAVKLEQTVMKTATGEELPPYKIPLVGRFYGETKSSAAESNRFYKNLTLLNEHENEIKGRREAREPIGNYLKDNPEARLAPMARKVYKDIQELRKRREKLVERDAPRESVKAVEEQIRRRMAMFNERVAQLKD